MKSNPKTFLFVGEDAFKREKIAEVSTKYLDPSQKDFNYDLIYAKESKKENLKDVFGRFPVGSDFRLVRLKGIENFDQQVKRQLLEFCKKPLKNLILIMETDCDDLKDEFLEELAAEVDFLYLVKKEHQINVFDLCKAIFNKNTALALKLLHELEVDSRNAPQILGGIIWQWEQMKHLANAKDLERGFKILHEIDKRLKTGKLKPHLALELLVVSLSSDLKEGATLSEY